MKLLGRTLLTFTVHYEGQAQCLSGYPKEHQDIWQSRDASVSDHNLGGMAEGCCEAALLHQVPILAAHKYALCFGR